MAWYYGTFACGCEGRVNVIGPHKNRQWIIDRKFEGLCEKCYMESLNEQREIERKEAEEKSKEMELPKLTGTEKQIEWVKVLRQKRINEAEQLNQNYIEFHSNLDLKEEEVPVILNYILANKTDAKYYIDNRDCTTIRFLYKEKSEALKSDQEKAKDKFNKDMEKMVKDEATAFPDSRITDVAVEIKVEQNTIKVFFERNYKFIDIVKDLDYRWDDVCWKRTIYEKNGAIEDRVAELGNKLLKAGFPVMILDEVIREKAINADYAFEIYRWIDIKEREFRITWRGMNDKLYKAARAIPGSKYKDGAVYIKIEHCEEVEEFLELYKFYFTKKAKKAIETYKEELKAIKTVEIKTIEREEIKDGLEEILNSSREVLVDLLDE